MSAPICPIHQTPMSVSQKGGGWYCTKKMPDQTYCKIKVAGTAMTPVPAPEIAWQPQAPQAPVAWTPPTPQAPAAQTSLLTDSGDAHLAAAALRFGASIITSRPIEHETADEAAAAGINIAITAFRTMKAYLP